MRAKEFLIDGAEQINVLLFAPASYLRAELLDHYTHIFALNGDHPHRFKFHIFADDGLRAALEAFARRFDGQAEPVTACTAQFHLVLAFGGDATLLRLNQFLRYHGEVPVVSIAVQPDFYTHFGLDEVPRLVAHIEALLTGRSAELSYVLVSLPRWGSALARNNEAVLHSTALAEVYVRAAGHRPCVFDVHLEGRHLTRLCCEGLVVATPLGSTGRNCALEGPLLSPGSEFGVLNAVLPSGCVFRPVVFGRHQRLRIALHESSPETAVVVFDSVEVDSLRIGEHLELAMDGPGIELVTLKLFEHWAGRVQRMVAKQ